MNKEIRKKVILAMELLARQINNENIFEGWLSNGVPDGDIPYGSLDTAHVDDYFVENKHFKELMECFLRRMVSAYKSGGLYCDGVVTKEVADKDIDKSEVISDFLASWAKSEEYSKEYQIKEIKELLKDIPLRLYEFLYNLASNYPTLDGEYLTNRLLVVNPKCDRSFKDLFIETHYGVSYKSIANLIFAGQKSDVDYSDGAFYDVICNLLDNSPQTLVTYLAYVAKKVLRFVGL